MGERGCAATCLPCAVPGLVARRATALDIGLSPNELSLSDSLVCILLEDLQKALLALFGLFVCVESHGLDVYSSYWSRPSMAEELCVWE